LTFSVFYSPQYVLWLAAPVALSGSMSMVVATVVLAWITLLYFPITYFMPHADWPFRSAMLLVTVARTTVIALALILPRRLADTAHAVRLRRDA
jgi:hypothetical protein